MLRLPLMKVKDFSSPSLSLSIWSEKVTTSQTYISTAILTPKLLWNNLPTPPDILPNWVMFDRLVKSYTAQDKLKRYGRPPSWSNFSVGIFNNLPLNPCILRTERLIFHYHMCPHRWHTLCCKYSFNPWRFRGKDTRVLRCQVVWISSSITSMNNSLCCPYNLCWPQILFPALTHSLWPWYVQYFPHFSRIQRLFYLRYADDVNKIIIYFALSSVISTNLLVSIDLISLFRISSFFKVLTLISDTIRYIKNSFYGILP